MRPILGSEGKAVRPGAGQPFISPALWMMVFAQKVHALYWPPTSTGSAVNFEADANQVAQLLAQQMQGRDTPAIELLREVASEKPASDLKERIQQWLRANAPG